jgi:8-oxo-dGTP pyrophosphatase MutT (NUDIX family)
MSLDVSYLELALKRRAYQEAARIGGEKIEKVTEAAVAIIIDAGEERLLLIQRTELFGDPWSGQMAFPGGKRDGGDETLFATALRETEEELGISLGADARFLGTLTAVRPIRPETRHLRVTPFVFAVEDSKLLASPAPNKEVAEAVWVPLCDLMKSENMQTDEIEFGGVSKIWHTYYYKKYEIWGLTGEMLFELLSLLRFA